MNNYKRVVISLGAAVLAGLLAYMPAKYRSACKETLVFGKANERTSAFANTDLNNADRASDPYWDKQWALKYTNALKASKSVVQKRQIKIALVDSGVDYNHPDLKNRVAKDLGYDFINNDKDPMDDSWHGTHIAGIIAAEANNNEGISGVVGDLDVVIIPIKVLDKDGAGPSNVIAEGIEYAVNQGADIINLSIDFTVKDELIQNALLYAKQKNVFVVAASGNVNSNCDEYSPAGDEGAYTVSAIDSFYKKADFSSFGKSVKTAAPGVEILSTVPGGGYEYRDGTSMAAPVVTGIAAMLKAEDPDLGPRTMEKILNESAIAIGDPNNELDKSYYGNGLIDAYKAVTNVQNRDKSVLLKTY